MDQSSGTVPVKSASRVAFTKTNTSKMSCPKDQDEAIWWDAVTTRLGLRAYPPSKKHPTGKRVWLYQYVDGNGRTRRMTIGDLSRVDLEAARAAVKAHAANVAQGRNPSVERKAKLNAATVGELITDYLVAAEAKQKASTYATTKLHLNVHAKALHPETLPPPREMIAGLLQKVTNEVGQTTANRVRAHLSAMFTWALKSGKMKGEANPATYTVRHKETPRDRLLSDDEIRALWKATDDSSEFSRIVRLLLATACRRDEIGQLDWSEVHEDRITIAATRMKGGIPHTLPMANLIKALLPPRSTGPVFGKRKHTAGTGFQGWGKATDKLRQRVDKELGKPADRFTLHDLRRTARSLMSRGGVPPDIAERVLAHKVAGIRGVYDHYAYFDEKREALNRLAVVLADIVDK